MNDISEENTLYRLNLMISDEKEGYVFNSYGQSKYLRDAVVALDSIRRYDKTRKVALYCCKDHKKLLREYNLESHFDIVEELEPENQSITGFKHNIHKFMPFDKNLYLDSDMVLCKNPDRLWQSLSPYGYTATGQDSADVFFGATKGFGVLLDIFFRKRQRTLKRFKFSHLYRIQSGLIFAKNRELAENIDILATKYLNAKDETHFVSRKNEKGRSLESCEWSIAMAMTKLELYVYPWFNGYESPQLDYISGFTIHDDDFKNVKCLYFSNPFVYSLRGLKAGFARSFFLSIFELFPRGKDHMYVTPYFLHFGWKHEKSLHDAFAKKRWDEIVGNRT